MKFILTTVTEWHSWSQLQSHHLSLTISPWPSYGQAGWILIYCGDHIVIRHLGETCDQNTAPSITTHSSNTSIAAVCGNIICIVSAPRVVHTSGGQCPPVWWQHITAAPSPSLRILKFVCTGILQHKPVTSSYFLAAQTSRFQIHFTSIAIRDFSEKQTKILSIKYQGFLREEWKVPSFDVSMPHLTVTMGEKY